VYSRAGSPCHEIARKLEFSRQTLYTISNEIQWPNGAGLLGDFGSKLTIKQMERILK